MKTTRNITIVLSAEARCKVSIETEGRSHLDKVERDKLSRHLHDLSQTVADMSAPLPKTLPSSRMERAPFATPENMFVLYIELGTDNMCERSEVASALEAVAARVRRSTDTTGKIQDVDGVTVGEFEISFDD